MMMDNLVEWIGRGNRSTRRKPSPTPLSLTDRVCHLTVHDRCLMIFEDATSSNSHQSLRHHLKVTGFYSQLKTGTETAMPHILLNTGFFFCKVAYSGFNVPSNTLQRVSSWAVNQMPRGKSRSELVRICLPVMLCACLKATVFTEWYSWIILWWPLFCLRCAENVVISSEATYLIRL
jgi:hypothetical protein